MERSIVSSILILKEKDGGFLRAEVGQDISMSCEYRMSEEGGASLYSIKWYRDDQEFFRYIPTGNAAQYGVRTGLVFLSVANYDIIIFIIIIYWSQMFIHQTMQKRRLAFILSN